MINCKFFHSRLNNFRETGMPDLTLANNLLNVLCDSLNPGVGVDVTNNKKETQPEYTNNNNTTPD